VFLSFCLWASQCNDNQDLHFEFATNCQLSWRIFFVILLNVCRKCLNLTLNRPWHSPMPLIANLHDYHSLLVGTIQPLQLKQHHVIMYESVNHFPCPYSPQLFIV
jgi:hypothetical protein